MQYYYDRKTAGVVTHITEIPIDEDLARKLIEADEIVAKSIKAREKDESEVTDDPEFWKQVGPI